MFSDAVMRESNHHGEVESMSVDRGARPLPGRAVLVFDGDCGFCTWSADRLRRWSGSALVIVPWQRADLGALGLTEQECATAVQCVAPDGRFSGGRAVARALQGCRQPWHSVGQVLAWPALQPLVERGYVMVAANRHRLPGSTPACALDVTG
jgi:predicted DCC family thiol-disulfide oxidoreductase YuxK